jgi:hypothetical protein
MGRKESANGGVVKFFPVVSLESMYWATKLGGNVGIKSGESGSDVRLFAERKSPNKMGVIIKNNKII